MPTLMLACALALCLACAARTPTGPAAGSDAEKALALADQLFLDDLNESPGMSAHLRLPGSRHDFMPDPSATGRQAVDDRRQRQLDELRRLDGTKLAGTLAGITREAAIAALEGRLGARIC